MAKKTAKKSAEAKQEVRQVELQEQVDRADDRLRTSSMSSEPNEEDIRIRAYEKFLIRGGSHGSDLRDWMDAEEELRGEK